MDYNQLTVAKLKDELKQRDIPSTGLKLKKDFVDRLEQHDLENANQLEAASPTAQDAPLDTGAQEDNSKSVDPITSAEQDDLPSQDNQQQNPQGNNDTPSALDQEPEPPVEPTQNTGAIAAPAEEAMDPLPNTTDSKVQTNAEEPVSTEDRKRKRRSHSPVVSEELVHKKLKHEADGPVVHLQSDQDPTKDDVSMPDVPLEQPDLTLQPMSTSDDLAQPFTKESDKARSTKSPVERRFKNLIDPTESNTAQPALEPDDTAVSPAIHPATRALYLRDLVRPINPAALRDHLEDIARPPDHGDTSASLVEECYVDALRTHAFVLFTSISAASRARASTHARIWPPEPMRKQLWADFFPEEYFQEYLDTERASGGSRPSQAKRWELAYNTTDDGVDVQLVEAGPTMHRASTQSGAPNIPTGPRGSMSSGRRTSSAQNDQRRPSQPMLAPPPRRSSRVVEEASAPFLELDKLFNFTATKPKLYWQPVSENLADDRLDELDRETSRDWDPRADMKRNGDSLGRGLDQLKRYTFEDGDVLVDGGPEFGGGRAFGARAGNRGRGRRNGDSYRGH